MPSQPFLHLGMFVGGVTSIHYVLVCKKTSGGMPDFFGITRNTIVRSLVCAG